MKNKFRLTLSLVVLALASPVTMQVKADKSSTAGAVEFTCAAWENLPYPELFYRDGKNYLPLELSAGQRSKIYPLKVAESLELFIRKDNAATADASDPSLKYERIATASLLKGVKRMLFLIEPKQDAGGLPLQLLGMDDSLESFPAGSFRFINQTPGPLRIELAGVTHGLPQGALKVVTPELPENGGFLPAIIKNEEGRNVLEQRFFAERTGRELVIISPPAAGRTGLAMKFLSDTIPASPPSRRNPSPRK